MNILFAVCLLIVHGIAGLGAFETAHGTYQIIVEENSNPLVNDAIVHGLQKFNLPFFDQKNCQFFSIYAVDKNSRIIGGLCGDILGRSAGVDYVWVDEEKSRQGIGTQLFSQLETFAKSKNCDCIQVFTYKFQAPEFYKKLGFKCVGIISNWIEGHDVMFFKKYLDAQ